MIRPNYKDFRNSKFIISSGKILQHSAKGSTWEEHKYIKKVDGTYYYPDNYEGGRHLPDNDEKKSKEFDHEKAATEFNNFFKSLADTGSAYFGSKEEWESMSIEDFKELYKDILGRDPDKDLSKEALQNMFNSVKKQNAVDNTDNNKSTDKDIDTLANEVLRGNFGNGQERKEPLGEKYDEVQKRVNELSKNSKKTPSAVSKEPVMETSTKVSPSSYIDLKEKATAILKSVGNARIKGRRKR